MTGISSGRGGRSAGLPHRPSCVWPMGEGTLSRSQDRRADHGGCVAGRAFNGAGTSVNKQLPASFATLTTTIMARWSEPRRQL